MFLLIVISVLYIFQLIGIVIILSSGAIDNKKELKRYFIPIFLLFFLYIARIIKDAYKNYKELK